MSEPERSGLLLQDGAEVDRGGRAIDIRPVPESSTTPEDSGLHIIQIDHTKLDHGGRRRAAAADQTSVDRAGHRRLSSDGRRL